jgi:hypothetical protein
MSGKTQKGKALEKWVPSKEYKDNYDRIFGKKDTDENIEEEENGKGDSGI